MYTATKHYEVGFSTAFRQWRSTSHCRFVHGYGLKFTFEFQAETLDDNNWVVDFGSLNGLKQILEQYFDHKLIIQEDDPLLAQFQNLHAKGACDLVIMKNVSCEAFARFAYAIASVWSGISIHKVTVHENNANSASYSEG